MSKKASKIRWLSMTIAFVFFTFGVYIFGLKIAAKYEIPIFACPINHEGTLGGSCYTLSHLKSWSQNQQITDIVFFVLYTIVIAFVFGRLLCGYLCPIGFIQDVLDKIRQFLRIDQIKISERQYKVINVIKWSMLVIFIVGGFLWKFNFCSICPVLVFTPPLAGVKLGFSISFIVAIFFIVGSFFKRRLWCNICPLGLLVGLFNKVSFVSLKKDCQACTECGACYEACPMGIKGIYTEREKSVVSTEDCLMCIECIHRCPEKDALKLTYLGVDLYKASRKNFVENQGQNKK